MRNQTPEVETRIHEIPPAKTLLTKKQKKLIEEHVEYARALARKFYRSKRLPGVEVDELISAALVGLCDAASRYDKKVNDCFKNYARIRIVGAMLDYLRSSDGCPTQLVAEMGVFRPLRLCNNERSKQSVEVDRRINLHYLAAEEEWGVRIHAGVDYHNAELSYVNHKTPEERAEEAEVFVYILRLIKVLPPEEQEILFRCYLKDQSLREIGKCIRNVSKSWVSRVHTRAIDRLREMFEENECQCSLNLVTHVVQ